MQVLRLKVVICIRALPQVKLMHISLFLFSREENMLETTAQNEAWKKKKQNTQKRSTAPVCQERVQCPNLELKRFVPQSGLDELSIVFIF